MHCLARVRLVISTVIATFRRPQLLAAAVRSALAQRGRDLDVEVIVVDDDPAHSARRILRELADPAVRCIERSKPSGGFPGAVRNDGLLLAQRPYIHFLDDDDLMLPGAYQALAAALESSRHAGAAMGRIEPFGAEGPSLAAERAYFERAAHRGQRLCKPGRRNRLLAALLYGEAPLVTSAVLWRRHELVHAGGFDPALALCEDVELLARVARRSPVLFVDRAVVGYRISPGSLAHRAGAPFDEAYRRIHQTWRRAYGALETARLHLIARTALPRP